MISPPCCTAKKKSLWRGEKKHCSDSYKNMTWSWWLLADSLPVTKFTPVTSIAFPLFFIHLCGTAIIPLFVSAGLVAQLTLLLTGARPVRCVSINHCVLLFTMPHITAALGPHSRSSRNKKQIFIHSSPALLFTRLCSAGQDPENLISSCLRGR